MLKKNVVTLLAALSILVLLSSVALAKQIVIMNGTDFDLHAMALAPSESSNWGDDLLGNGILRPGEGIQINITGDTHNWDLAVVDNEETQLNFENLNLTNVNTITLNSDGTANFQ